MKVLLITPPLTQLNTPYPATTVLKALLDSHGHEAHQVDLGIELVSRIYTRETLERLFVETGRAPVSTSPGNLGTETGNLGTETGNLGTETGNLGTETGNLGTETGNLGTETGNLGTETGNLGTETGNLGTETGTRPVSTWMRQVLACIDPVMRFLRGQDNTLAPRIANRSLLPEGPRFNNIGDLEWAFGIAGIEDKARHLATLFIEDIADWIREHVDSHFDLIRYAEQISTYAATFDELDAALQAPPTPVTTLMLELLEAHLRRVEPEVVCFTIPFPGCLYGALKCGQYIKANHPGIKIALGGGFPSTEWRQMREPRIYHYCDQVILDDGEEELLAFVETGPAPSHPSRTASSRRCRDGAGPVSTLETIELTPSFEGLPLELYLSLAEMTNPMHRLWSSGRWNKLMMAHGCYWHRCAFCDTSLPYIADYKAPTAASVVNKMERIAAQTGTTGFHFVDEALPPKLLEEVSREILRRGDTFTWWGNIRFEKAYSAELADLMAEAGCIAVSGGLEVASDRLLKLMQKGVTIEQTVQACRHFRQAGIMVHTYLMYGFPTETLQESVNALEVVRRMFDEGIVQSAFWHRYAMTCHSPSGLHPEEYGARRSSLETNPFCNNEVEWVPADNSQFSTLNSQFPYDIEAVGRALSFATYNYMNDIGLDMPLKNWFTIKIPKPTI